MTFQAIGLLRKIKKVQRSESGTVWIDDDNKSISTVISHGETPLTADLSKRWDGFYSTTKYLVDQNLLERRNAKYIHLKHNGYCYVQELLTRFFRALISSVLVPIAVAFITTVVSLWLTGAFTVPPQ